MTWLSNRIALQRHLERDSLDDFLAWSTVRATMYVGSEAGYIAPEYQELKKDWEIWIPATKCQNFGCDVFREGESYTFDPNLIHQAYHLKQWLGRTRQDLTQMTSIIEFGAGYGAMALILHRLGYRGYYYIIDLPELIQLQKYYLGRVAPELAGRTFWLQSQPLSGMSCNLFIASHSLSEIPAEDRERLLSTVTAKEFLFASSYEFEGVDNAVWFQRFAGSVVGYDWLFEAHKWQENAFYMTGVELD